MAKRRYSGSTSRATKRRKYGPRRALGRYRRRKYIKRRKDQIAPVPKTKKVTLKYTTEVTLNPGSGSTATYRFRANDLYDPDFETGGHQPRGFDQWMAFYNHFTVIGSMIKVTFMSSSTTAASYVMIKLDDDSTLTDSTAQGNLEQPYTTWKICSSVGDGTRATLWNRFSAKKFLGISHPLSS